MKTFTTILIVILTIILGRYFVININNRFIEIIFNIYYSIFICIFGYGIYNIIKYFEDDNRQ